MAIWTDDPVSPSKRLLGPFPAQQIAFLSMNHTPNLPRITYTICPRCKNCQQSTDGWTYGNPPDEIVLTRELINRLRTNGSFTTATIRALGFSRLPAKGWAHALVGTIIPRKIYEDALKGVGQYSKYTLKQKQLL